MLFTTAKNTRTDGTAPKAVVITSEVVIQALPSEGGGPPLTRLVRRSGSVNKVFCTT